MRITRVQGYEVIVPTAPGRVHSPEYGPAVFPTVPKLILEVETDEGIHGLGETLRGTSEETIRSALGRLAGVDLRRICLQEPPTFDLSVEETLAYEHPQRPNRVTERSFNSMAHAAIHAMLLDLLGKRAELPAVMLLGGPYRERVAVDGWMGRMNPEDSVRVARQVQAQGYRGIKFKCALEDDVVARAEAIREACGPDFKLTVDPNCRFYRPGDAMPMLRRLAAVGNVACVEDPFEKWNLDWYVMLRQAGLFAVAMHTSYSFQMLQAIRTGACDYMNLELLPWDVRQAGAACWAAGIRTWHGSGVDLGILEAMYLSVCAATKSMTLPSDIFGRSVREHNLITDALPVRDGTVAVPQGPGLGVELDHNALDRYTRRRFTIEL